MVWQDLFPLPGTRLDAEQEREVHLATQAHLGADWALAALVARYQPIIVRYLTRLTGKPERAHILAEHIFLRMERRLHGPHGGEHLRLWLLRASTEAGLDVLRHPHRESRDTHLLEASRRAALPGAAPAEAPASQRLRQRFGKLATLTSATARQARPLVWSRARRSPKELTAPATTEGSSKAASPASALRSEAELDALDPREALRHRIVRAVLAELPYGDAQCLALHLVAGLNHAEVAQALGIRPHAARRRIVQGLQLFGRRYEAALASMGIPLELAYGDVAQAEPAPAPRIAAERAVESLPPEQPAPPARGEDIPIKPARAREMPPLESDLPSFSPLPEPPAWQHATYDEQQVSSTASMSAFVPNGLHTSVAVMEAATLPSESVAPVAVDVPAMPTLVIEAAPQRIIAPEMTPEMAPAPQPPAVALTAPPAPTAQAEAPTEAPAETTPSLREQLATASANAIRVLTLPTVGAVADVVASVLPALEAPLHALTTTGTLAYEIVPDLDVPQTIVLPRRRPPKRDTTTPEEPVAHIASNVACVPVLTQRSAHAAAAADGADGAGIVPVLTPCPASETSQPLGAATPTIHIVPVLTPAARQASPTATS